MLSETVSVIGCAYIFNANTIILSHVSTISNFHLVPSATVHIIIGFPFISVNKLLQLTIVFCNVIHIVLKDKIWKFI